MSRANLVHSTSDESVAPIAKLHIGCSQRKSLLQLVRLMAEVEARKIVEDVNA